MSWVKLQLTRGSSGGQEWQVDASAAGARIEVGTDPECSWVVQAPGVAPKHLEIYWDGEVLWVARIHGAGEVRVDGLMVDDWYATAKGSMIRFGEAEMRVDAGAAALDTSGVANRDRETARIAGPDAHAEAKTRMASPSAAARGESPSLPDGPTAILATPESKHDPHIAAAATQIVKPAAPRQGDDDAAGRIAAFEAQMRAGGGPGHGDDPAPLPSGQATQLVALPDAPGAPAAPTGRRPPPPRIGANVSRVEREPTPVPPQPAPVPSAETPSVIVGNVEPSQPNAAGPADQSGPAPAADNPFAAPPVDDRKSRRERRRARGEKATSLPIRTWLLLVATVGALLFVLFMDDEEEAVPTPPDAGQEAQAGDSGSGNGSESGNGNGNGSGNENGSENGNESESENGSENGNGNENGSESESENGSENESGNESEGENEGEGEGEVEDGALVRRAVDALVANRQREAYDLYGRLADEHPDVPAYEAIHDILRRRLQASCTDGVDLQGNPCEEVE